MNIKQLDALSKVREQWLEALFNREKVSHNTQTPYFEHLHALHNRLKTLHNNE